MHIENKILINKVQSPQIGVQCKGMHRVRVNVSDLIELSSFVGSNYVETDLTDRHYVYILHDGSFPSKEKARGREISNFSVYEINILCVIFLCYQRNPTVIFYCICLSLVLA